jgi:hypothetical protein
VEPSPAAGVPPVDVPALPRDTGDRGDCPGGPQKDFAMSMLISVLITFVVVILVLYLVNLLPIDGRAKQIVRVIVIIIGVLSLLRYVAVF